MRYLLTALLFIGGLITLLPQALAHGSGPSYLLVNGQYVQTNPIHGLATDMFALDVTAETFVSGEPIQFEVDLKNLGFTAEARWKWDKSDTVFEEGLKLSHAFQRPGSYFVTLQIKGEPTGGQFSDYNSVRVNVAPTEGYVAPTIKIVGEGNDSGDVWSVKYRAEVSKDASADIKSYQWFLGDGTKSSDQLVRHKYKKGFYQAFPFIVVEDSNGLFSAVAFQIDESNNKFNITALPSFPDSVTVGKVEKPRSPWIYVLMPVAITGVLLTIFLLKKRTGV